MTHARVVAMRYSQKKQLLHESSNLVRTRTRCCIISILITIMITGGEAAGERVEAARSCAQAPQAQADHHHCCAWCRLGCHRNGNAATTYQSLAAAGQIH
jgi:hypothetical protein